jgi:dUTP pyrophosphatase
MKMQINIKRLKKIDLPAYATTDSAGIDLAAAIDESIEIKPGKRILIPTGIAIALPKGFEAQIRPRSGLAIKNGITLVNSPGTIDADYRGEICVILINHGESSFVVEPAMRIAQMVIAAYNRVSWNEVENLEETARSTGGFGSTGC